MLQKDYMSKCGIELKIDELADILKVPKDEIILAMDSNNSMESIDKNIGDEDGLSIKDKLSCKGDDIKDLIDKITVNDLMSSLDEKSRKIIMLRYFRFMTQTQVADLMGISQVQVSRLEKKILGRMKENYYA